MKFVLSVFVLNFPLCFLLLGDYKSLIPYQQLYCYNCLLWFAPTGTADHGDANHDCTTEVADVRELLVILSLC